ncbi:MAG TPA: 6-phosphogluconolactonase [Thermodesulfovibrionales bacterium]|nr:6-phosphogluconolactonase [Thermodesulfovibrionales bacterium]
MIPDYLVFDTSEEMWHYMGKMWKEISAKAIAEKGHFSAALSGGKTPTGFYQYLSGKYLQWKKTHLFLVDERFVPWDSPESNHRMLHENLLNRIQIPQENIHPIETGQSSPDISAKKYEEELRRFFRLNEGGLPEFDLILLGIGEDGHTASLFSGTTALKETKRLVVPARPGAALMDRISLTLSVINNAWNVVFLVSGHRKRGVMKKIREGRDTTLPASMVNPERGKLLFLMDREAAG